MDKTNCLTYSIQQDEDSFEDVSAKGGNKLLETSCQELVRASCIGNTPRYMSHDCHVTAMCDVRFEIAIRQMGSAAVFLYRSPHYRSSDVCNKRITFRQR